MRLSDAHWSLVTARATRAAAAAITALETHKVQYVTGGGWAVWAHEPSTPSGGGRGRGEVGRARGCLGGVGGAAVRG